MQSVLLKWKIMLLCWSMLLLCLSANAENIVKFRESGENVILKCSSARCISNIKDFVGMYLYRGDKVREDVLYYHPNPQSVDKITEGRRYKDRIQTKGSLEDHTITISKLTVNDSGIYSCVYKKFPQGETKCNVYTVTVKDDLQAFSSFHTVAGVTPSHIPDKAASKECGDQQCPSLVQIILTTCGITMLVTMIVTLFILRVKHWTCSRGMTRSTSQSSNDYVYEVMTKNGLNRVHP